MFRKSLNMPANKKVLSAGILLGVSLMAIKLSNHNLFMRREAKPMESLYPPVGTPSPK